MAQLKSPVDKVSRCTLRDEDDWQLTVGSGGHGETLGADLEWEYLASHDPSNWSPGGGKEEDEDTDESDGCLLCSKVLDNGSALWILT